MASTIYNSFKRDIANGSIDLDTDTIKVMLTSGSYAANADTHTKRSDVTNEVTGTNWSAGGVALANKTVTADNTNDRGVFDADDVSVSTATFTGATQAVLYKSRGGASSADELIACIDLGGTFSPTAGTFTITWSSNGILTLS